MVITHSALSQRTKACDLRQNMELAKPGGKTFKATNAAVAAETTITAVKAGSTIAAVEARDGGGHQSRLVSAW